MRRFAWPKRYVAGVATAVFLPLVIGLSPALADTPLQQSGTVGPHSLRDAGTQYGATCTYKYINQSNDQKLESITVAPPKVKAISGKHDVGWQFKVQRQRNGGAWKTTYTSPVQRIATSASKNAAFTSMHVGVAVPKADFDTTYFEYQVIVKMVWYASDGSVEGWATDRVDNYLEHWTPPYGSDQNSMCDAEADLQI